MAQEITVGGGGAFVPTELGTSQSYSLRASTSPLVLTPPSGKVIRLDSLTGNIENVSISVGGSDIISGSLSSTPNVTGEFSVNNHPPQAASGVKAPIEAFEKDQTISILTTEATAATVHFSVTYGDLK